MVMKEYSALFRSEVFGRSQEPLFGRSQEPMYGTRPWCLVQAITRHRCPDPHLGSWNCLPHQAHIAPSEPMSSTDQQGSSLDSFPTFPPPYPHFNRPSGFWPCVKSCLVGGSDKYSLLYLDFQNWSHNVRCTLVSYSGHLFWRRGLTPSAGDTVSVFEASPTEG